MDHRRPTYSAHQPSTTAVTGPVEVRCTLESDRIADIVDRQLGAISGHYPFRVAIRLL
jgi:hypothetical protein